MVSDIIIQVKDYTLFIYRLLLKSIHFYKLSDIKNVGASINNINITLKVILKVWLP